MAQFFASVGGMDDDGSGRDGPPSLEISVEISNRYDALLHRLRNRRARHEHGGDYHQVPNQ